MGTDALHLVYLAQPPGSSSAAVERLEEAGFVVTVAAFEDGPACIEAVDPEGFVVDLGDDGHGLKVTRWIRQTDPWRDRPCFVTRTGPQTQEILDKEIRGVRVVESDLTERVADAFAGRTGFKIEGGPGVTQDGDIMIV